MPKSQLLNANPFIGPRRAFEAVGKEVFGEAWQPDCINDRKDNERREALAILRNALRSGNVAAYWRSLDLDRLLK